MPPALVALERPVPLLRVVARQRIALLQHHLHAVLLPLHELSVRLLVERALRLRALLALRAEEELARVARVIALDVIDRLVHQPHGHLGGDGLALVVARRDEQRAVLARLVLGAVGLHVHREEMLRGRHDDLLRVHVNLLVRDHRGAEEHVGHMGIAELQLDQLHRAGEMHHLVADELVRLDGEEHVTVVAVRHEHDGSLLSAAERVAVHDDFHAAVAVAEFSARVVRDPQRRLRADGLRRAIRERVFRQPRHLVIALALRREDQVHLALGVRLERAREDFVAVIATEFQPPRTLPDLRRGRELPIALQRLQLRPLHFLASGVHPDFFPILARDLDEALDDGGLLVRVLRAEVHGRLVAGLVEVVLRLGVDVVALARDAHGAAAGDFASARVHHARLDAELEVLPVVLRRLELQHRLARRVGLERLAFQDLPAATAAKAATATEAVEAFVLLVEPAELARLLPREVIRVLMHDDLDRRVRHRPAEIVVGLDVDLDLVTGAEGFLAPVHLGRLHGDLELRQLVFLQAKERRVADVRVVALVAELHLILTETLLLGEFERRPTGAELVQLEVALLHLRAVRAGDGEGNRLVRRRGIHRAVVAANHRLPLHRLLRAIRRAVSEGVDAPRLVRVAIGVSVAGAEGLFVPERGGGEDFHVVVHRPGDFKHREAVLVRRLVLRARLPLVVAHMPPFPEASLRVRQRLAGERIRDEDEGGLAAGLEHQRRIGHEHEVARGLPAALRFEDVSAGAQLAVHAQRRVARAVVALVLRVVRPRLRLLATG